MATVAARRISIRSFATLSRWISGGQVHRPCHLRGTWPVTGHRGPPDVLRSARRTYTIFTSDKIFEIPENTTYHQLILEKCRSRANRPALVDEDSGTSCTYGELESAVTRMASALHKRGFQKGQVLCTYAPNSLELVLTYLAVSASGGTLTMANPNLKSEELRHVLSVSGASRIYVHTAQASTVSELLNSYDNVKAADVIYQNEAPSSGGTDFWSLVAEGDLEMPSVEFAPRKDIAMLPFSSGTTGRPKGTMLSHYALVAALEAHRFSDQLLQKEGDHVVAVFPFFHVAGVIGELFSHLYMGCTIHTRYAFNFDTFLRDISHVKPHTVLIPPPVLRLLAYDSRVDDHDLSSLRRICCGAAAVGENLRAAATERLNLQQVGQMYGLSELGNITHSTIGYEDVPPFSIGRPLPNFHAKVIDLETGDILPENTPGELCIKGPSIMLGYLGNEKATAEMIDDEGWLHTGDLAYIDAQGYVFIEGRLKDVIKTYGFQISPDEIEDVLLKHEDVMEAGVIGIPDEKAGEVPRAYVVLRQGANTTAEELQHHVADKVVYYKHLRGGVRFVDALPLLPSGKILRRVLREDTARH